VLASLLKEIRWLLLAAALASAVSGACSVVLIAQIGATLSAGTTNASDALRFACIVLTLMLAGTSAGVLFERLRQRTNVELRRSIVERVVSAPYQTLERIGGASIQSALSEHTANVTQFFVSLPVLLSNAVVVIGCLFYLAMLSPQVFLAALVVIVLGSLGYHFAHLRAIDFLRRGSKEQDRLFAHFRSLTEGAKELQLNRRKCDVFRQEVIGQSLEALRRERTIGMTIFIVASHWGNFLIYAFIGLVIFVLAGDAPGRTQVMTGFALVLIYMVSPLQSLLLAIPNTNLARVAMDRIEDLMRQIGSPEVSPVGAEPARLYSLALVGVTHRYYHEQSDEFFQLGPVDLTLAASEIVFLVGGNGSGKTTLAKLLVGLYAPVTGRIVFNGANVDDASRSAYRQNFSAIFSDFHLFDRLLDADDRDLDRKANRLLEKLHLQHKVRVRQGAFSTQALSQGQRKRLALVVAYLENRPILVFDEWAADQDPAFKEVFYREFLPELRAAGKTVLVISHDDRYFHLADRLVRMDNGQVVSIDFPALISSSSRRGRTEEPAALR